MKKLWALRYVLGMLLAFAAFVSTFAWAVGHYPRYVGYGILGLAVLVVAMQPRVRRERKRNAQLVEAAFQNAYGQLSPPPALVRSNSYGYPSFEVKFRSKADKESAARLNDAFTAEIQNIFQRHGPRRRPFQAEQAISFTYPGYVEDILDQFRQAKLQAQQDKPTPDEHA